MVKQKIEMRFLLSALYVLDKPIAWLAPSLCVSP